MSCPNCPIKGACLAWPTFCEWAAEDPPDPVKLAHIRNRSAPGDPSRTPAPSPQAAAAIESIRLARAARACPYRSTDAGCGCSGGRCALRGGAVVSHLDCFPCVERYG